MVDSKEQRIREKTLKKENCIWVSLCARENSDDIRPAPSGHNVKEQCLDCRESIDNWYCRVMDGRQPNKKSLDNNGSLQCGCTPDQIKALVDARFQELGMEDRRYVPPKTMIDIFSSLLRKFTKR